jgi:hypothetical protein
VKYGMGIFFFFFFYVFTVLPWYAQETHGDHREKHLLKCRPPYSLSPAEDTHLGTAASTPHEERPLLAASTRRCNRRPTRTASYISAGPLQTSKNGASCGWPLVAERLPRVAAE